VGRRVRGLEKSGESYQRSDISDQEARKGQSKITP